DADAIENLAYGSGTEGSCSYFLMLNTLYTELVKKVGGQLLGEIVEQPRIRDEPDVVGGDGAKLPLAIKASHNAASQVVHSDGVLEPGVHCGGIPEMRKAQLLDPPQALKLRRIDQLSRDGVKRDRSVNRIPYHRIVCHAD